MNSKVPVLGKKWFSFLLFIFWIVSSVIAYKAYEKLKHNQIKSFSITGYHLDFTKKSSLRLGKTPQKMDYLNSRRSADIWLPTGLIPSEIGELQWRNGALQLILNDQICDPQKEETPYDRTVFPRVFSHNWKQRFQKKEVISARELQEGLILDYPVKGYLKLSFEELSPGQVKMSFTPPFGHFTFPLQGLTTDGQDKVEIVINSAKGFADLNSDIQRVELATPDQLPLAFLLTFEEDSIYQSTDIDSRGKNIGSSGSEVLLPGTAVYIQYHLPKKFKKFTISCLCLYLVLFFLYYFKIFFTESHISSMVHRLISIPIIIFATLLNFSIPLLFYYLIHFPGIENREDFAITGSLSIVVFCLYVFTSDYTKNFFDFFVKIIFKNGFWFILFILALFISLLTKNQRTWFLPAHISGRIILLISLPLCIVFSRKILRFMRSKLNNFHPLYIILLPLIIITAVFLLYQFCTKDFGFPIIGLIAFIFAYSCLSFRHGNNTSFKSFKYLLFFYFSIIILSFIPFFKHHLSQTHDRLALLLNQHETTQIALDHVGNLKIGDITSTQKHRLILQESINNFQPFQDKLVVPRELHGVFHTDYVILFSVLFYGTWFWFFIAFLFIFLFLSILMLIFIIPKSKSSKNEALVIGIALVILSYPCQMIYMFAAMTRAAPLTGQSIPFLSLSIVEPAIFIFFYLIFFNGFFLSTEALNSQTLLPISKIQGRLFAIAALPIIIFLAIGFARVKHDGPITTTEFFGKPTARHNIATFLQKQASEKKKLLSFLKTVDISKLDDDAKRAFFEIAAKQHHGHISSGDGFFRQDKYWTISPFQKETVRPESFLRRLEFQPFRSFVVQTLPNPGFDLVAMGGKFYFAGTSEIAQDFRTLDSFNVTNQSVVPKGGEHLVGRNPKIVKRLINGKPGIHYQDCQILGTLPLAPRLNNKKQLTIDLKLQAIIHTTLHSFSKGQLITGAAVVVMDNQTGAIKAMVSMPFLPAGSTLMAQQAWFQEINQNGFAISGPSTNIALMGYNIGSSWKPIQSAAMLLGNPNNINKTYRCPSKGLEIDCNNHLRPKTIDFNTYIQKSCNHYSAMMLLETFKKSKEKTAFLNNLNDVFQISTKSNQSLLDFKKDEITDFYSPSAGSIESLNPSILKDRQILERISIGGDDSRIPLIWLTTCFSRIISGTMIKPHLFETSTEYAPPEIDDPNQVLSDIKSAMLLVGRTGGTVRDLSNHFPTTAVYAKSGTSQQDESKALYNSVLVFGTDRYTFATIFLSTRAKGAAKNYTYKLLPILKEAHPGYLQGVKP